MTIDEAINKLNWALDNNTIENVQSAYEYIEAVEMAIKALEQESILDKIRAEINSPNRGTCDYFIVDRIEEIIDKYKAESEG